MAVQLFAPPALMLAVASDHAAAAGFRERILAVANPYTHLGGGQTYAGWTAAYDALDVEDQYSLMPNLEFPWLGVLNAKTDATPSASWYTTYLSIAQTEFTRLGLGTPSVATPMSTWKFVADDLWRRVATFARERNTVNLWHFATPGWSFANGTGAPIEGFRNSSTRSYWQSDGTYFPPHGTVAAQTYAANGQLPGLMRAQEGATADGLGFYAAMPNPVDYAVCVPAWQLADANVDRKSSAGVVVSPDYEASMAAEWYAATYASMPFHYAAARDQAAIADPTLEAAAERNIASIVLIGPATPDAAGSSYVSRNHWIGLFDEDPAVWAQRVIGSHFRAADADTPNVRRPDVIVCWYDYHYYCNVYPGLLRSDPGNADKVKGIDQSRHAWEKLLCGRPLLSLSGATGVDPTGSIDFAAHDAFFAAQNLGDALWADANSSVVWRNASGVLHATIIAAGLTLDFSPGGVSERIAPYLSTAQKNGTAAITGADIANARNLYATEWGVQALEASAEIVSTQAVGGGAQAIPAYSVTRGAVPTANTVIHSGEGTTRLPKNGELMSVLAEGEPARSFVLKPDGTVDEIGSRAYPLLIGAYL